MADVNEVVQVSSDVIKQCPHCAGAFKFSDPPDLDERINHFLRHGYKLLHVGQQTTSVDGAPWQTTVAILGK
jgi:hypothetical protein